VVFSGPELERLFPLLVRHGVLRFDGAQVMRFLHERRHGREDRITSDLRERSEGVRLKHWHNDNSIKMYDKADGQVLRVETTVNDASDFRVYRPKQGDPAGPKQWMPLRKSVADLHRRAQVSQKANERYLNALSAADDRTRLEELLHPALQRVEYKGQFVRALDPFAGDADLLQAVGRAEFALNGFRNRDLQALLYDRVADRDKAEQRRRSAAISRKLRLLRAHRLIVKVASTHRYQLTDVGTRLLTAVSAARNTPVSRLFETAA
jgi:hypothetical protein